MENKISCNNFIKMANYLAVNRKQIMKDDIEFTEFLINSVEQKKLLPTTALYLYCYRFDIKQFILADLQVKDSGERPPYLDFFDSIMSGQDIAPLLQAIDSQRESEAMP